MKAALALLALAGTSSALLTADYVEANSNALWASFKQTHNKIYTPSEDAARKAVFKMNMLKAAEAQTRHPQATFGATKFSDLTEEEFYPYAHGRVHIPKVKKGVPPMYTEAELAQFSGEMDWRSKGAVTAIKDQAQCGSCWAFGTTGVTESHNFLHGNGNLTPLSEQEFVSCEKDLYACNGGLPTVAYEWLLNNHNGEFVTEESYPYTSGHGRVAPCASDVASKPVGATIKGYVELPSDEEQMAAWLVQNGPISIGVNAASDWQSYIGGVLTGCRAVQPDHAVLLVGVTADYWIVKNSWGPSWGESGYVRLEFGTNQCNLNFDATAPTF